MLPAQIFAAEWAALGKGLRPQKYKSFTSTEKRLPSGFAFLIAFLLIFGDIWYVLTYRNAEDHNVNSAEPLSCIASVIVNNQQQTAKKSNVVRKQVICPPDIH